MAGCMSEHWLIPWLHRKLRSLSGCRSAAYICHLKPQWRSDATKLGTSCCVVSILCALGLLQC